VGITVIDTALYPTVTVKTTVPAAAGATTARRTTTTRCSYVLERYHKQVQHHFIH
jgi:hypothetical protein